jgi:predicted GTPase
MVVCVGCRRNQQEISRGNGEVNLNLIDFVIIALILIDSVLSCYHVSQVKNTGKESIQWGKLSCMPHDQITFFIFISLG